MKKTVSVILILCLSLFSLVGCKDGENASSKKTDAKDKEIIDSVIEAVNGVESLYLESKTDSSMSVMGNRVDSSSTAICEVDVKDKVQHVIISMTASGEKMDTECYVKENASGADAYLKANGTWLKQTGIPYDKVNELGLSTDSYNLMVMYLELLKEKSEIKEKTVDGKECYVISGEIDAGEEELLKKAGLGNTLQQLVQSGMTSSEIDEIISNVEEMEIIISVDKESLLPVKMKIDITEVTQNIMDGLAKVLGETGEIKVEKNVAVSKYSRYNEMDEITIPEEVLNAEEVVLYQ